MLLKRYNALFTSLTAHSGKPSARFSFFGLVGLVRDLHCAIHKRCCMTVLYRKTRYLFSTWYYKISLEKNVASVESICVPRFTSSCCFELKQYSRNVTSQKNDFEQDVYNPSKKISRDEYQARYDKAFRGDIKIKLNGKIVETPSLVAGMTTTRIRPNRN